MRFMRFMRFRAVLTIVAGFVAAAGCERQPAASTPAATETVTPAPTPDALADPPPTPSTTPAGTPTTAPDQTATTAPASPTPPVWQPSDDPKMAKFLGLAAPKPATWIEHPPQGTMRVTTFIVPGRDGNEAAHIVVFYFGPHQGGTVDANIDRWQEQFEPDAEGNLVEPMVERFEADGMPVTLVELAGSWMKMGATWYTPNQTFIAAIVEAPVGNVYIRFAGDTATVEENAREFDRMIRGLHKTGPG